MDLTIRKASVHDAEGIAKVHVESWKSTYKGIMKDSILDSLSVEQRTELWQKNVQNPSNIVLVAEVSGQVVGFASGSAANKDEYPQYDGDLTAIYFLEDCQGKGYGKKMLDALLQEFKQVGFASVIVKVLDKNHSRTFYERFGAKCIHQQDVPQYGDNLKLLTYVWDRIS